MILFLGRKKVEKWLENIECGPVEPMVAWEGVIQSTSSHLRSPRG